MCKEYLRRVRVRDNGSGIGKKRFTIGEESSALTNQSDQALPSPQHFSPPLLLLLLG